MKNEYLPQTAVIKEIISETPDTKTFTLELKGQPIRYQPGQFLILSLAGFGEAPFTFASLSRGRVFQISVRRVGALTAALHQLKMNDTVGVRGPFGNFFPLNKLKKKNMLFVAGGCGIAPLRPLIQHVFKNRKGYAKIEIIYGCRTPVDLAYKNEFKSWSANPDTEVRLTVDTPDDKWAGACGVVCTLFPEIKLKPRNTFAFLCGPAVMIKAGIADILKIGFKEGNIYASLERHMKCGIGKCGHCYIGGKYACLDGPNFSYAEMKRLGIEA